MLKHMVNISNRNYSSAEEKLFYNSKAPSESSDQTKMLASNLPIIKGFVLLSMKPAQDQQKSTGIS